MASDGDALLLLQKEFPRLKSYFLPSYNIKYTRNGKNLRYKLLVKIPSVISASKKEQKIVEQLIKKENIIGIISDNRFGVYNKQIPSVYITHQLKVFSGITTWITSKIHQKIIKKFDECWIPDIKGEPNYSGELGHLEKHNLNLKYVGVLSRFTYQKLEIKYNLLVVLSGPEPQRSLLENKLLVELKNYKGNVLFVRGVLAEKKIAASSNIEIVNYLLTKDLERAMNQSEIVLARSGYSTILDLAVLGKKAFFIPTPGQYEQEYLAKIMSEKLIAPFKEQDNYKLDNLKDLENYGGFKKEESSIDLDLFNLFESK